MDLVNFEHLMTFLTQTFTKFTDKIPGTTRGLAPPLQGHFKNLISPISCKCSENGKMGREK